MDAKISGLEVEEASIDQAEVAEGFLNLVMTVSFVNLG